MTDTALHLSPLPTAGWALILLATALTTAAHRSPSRTHSAPAQRAHGAMTVHRNIGTILMAALLICMDTHHSSTATGGHAGHTGDLLTLTLAAGTTVYTLTSLWLTTRHPPLPIAHRVEAALMGTSVLLMGIASLV